MIVTVSCRSDEIVAQVRGNLIYITLHDGNVYIEYDDIEHGIADDLIKNGIPENQIILAYLPEMAA